ncbi:MAG: NAD(P)H-hydrate dehydratase [Myxococcota bacterium]
MARGRTQQQSAPVPARGAHRAGVWPLVTAAEMQALDRQTIEGRGLPGELLMESAGRALVAPVLALLAADRRGPRDRRIVRAICGAGNNGGDGFVAVRHLRAEGIEAEALLIGDPAQLPADAAANWRRLVALGGAAAAARAIRPDVGAFDWDALFDGTSVAIDALFGTGLRRPVEGGLARVIEAQNAARRRGLRVVAVDLPSGIAADTGQILGVAVEADRTVTISLPKPGLALEPGRSRAGRIEVARVGIDDPDPARPERIELWNARAALARFPARDRDGHKGRFGHVLLAAGSPGKWGAASLSARAALRAGAGLVTLVLPEAEGLSLPNACAELMTERAPATKSGGFARESAVTIGALARARTVLALGPGLGSDPETVDCVRRLVAEVERPLVVDADGLNALVGSLEGLRARSSPTVLTPHPGEAARLLESDAATINADRVAAARRLASVSGAVVLLKGAGTVVAAPDGRVLIVPTGGPALASGGTGDVLTGVVASLLAAGLEAFDAAGLAAWWHGAAADRSPQAGPGFGLLARELADALPGAAAALRGEVVALDADTDAGAGADSEGEDAGDGRAGGADLSLRFPGP